MGKPLQQTETPVQPTSEGPISSCQIPLTASLSDAQTPDQNLITSGQGSIRNSDDQSRPEFKNDSYVYDKSGKLGEMFWKFYDWPKKHNKSIEANWHGDKSFDPLWKAFKRNKIPRNDNGRLFKRGFNAIRSEQSGLF